MVAIQILLACFATLNWGAWLAPARVALTDLFASPRSSLTGFVFADGDGDGVFGSMYDQPLPGVEVRLEASCGGSPNLYRATVTDEEGRYEFARVGRGCFCVRALAPSGYLETTPVGEEIQMTWGDGVIQHHVGLALPGHIIGIVFDDANGNGFQDADEAGMADVPVHLYGDTNNDGTLDAGDVLSGTATTDPAEGAFAFVDRLPGRYLLALTLPPGFVATTADVQAFLLVTGESGGELLYFFGLRQIDAPLTDATVTR